LKRRVRKGTLRKALILGKEQFLRKSDIFITRSFKIMTMWARKHDQCMECGTVEIKHVARGLCVKCYNDFIQKRHSGVKKKGEWFAKKLNSELLFELYWDESKSTSDIAKTFGITRQAVYLKMKNWKIPKRTLGDARTMALDKGKISFDRVSDSGERITVQLEKRYVNEKFFDEWSPEMAYVLGLIATDGNIQKTPSRGANAKPRNLKTLSFAQKEPELLEKILGLMRSNAKIIFQKERRYQHTTAGAIYTFAIRNDTIYDSLVELGISERKSLSIVFPDIPEPYVRHFIRGCWDGDGSIGKHSENSYHARFFSGSKVFVEGMLAELEKAGFPSRRIYSRNEGTFFWFSYVGKIVGKLYIYLYEDVPSSMRYERKYLIFRKSFEKCSTDQMNLDL